MNRKYIVATRPSLLAYTQTMQTVSLLQKLHPDIEFEILKISTHGDKVTEKPLTQFGGTGVFVKELENAVLEGRADFAIHSLKDVPSIQPDGLVLAAFAPREDVCDVLLLNAAESIAHLPDNCIIGTGSPRRIVQLQQLKPNAQFKELRGNIDTRIQKLENAEYDAIVLAAAGLNRLGRPIPESAFLSVEESIPAIGQGAICLECRADDTETFALLQSINHKATEIAITAERSLMKRIGGGCKFPLGAYAQIIDGKLEMIAMTGDHHTGKMIRIADVDLPENAETLGVKMAERMILMAEEEGISLLVE